MTQEDTMDVITQLEAILGDVKDVAANVRLDQFDDPTPCANFVVRDLFTHMIGGASAFSPLLRGDTGSAPDDPAALSDADRAAAFGAAMDDLLASAKAPGAFGRACEVPFGVVPGEVLARFITVDGMVHAWDIATATGQDYAPSDDLAGAVLRSARDLIAPELRDGDTFAAETVIPESAPSLLRLVAFTGRDVAA